MLQMARLQILHQQKQFFVQGPMIEQAVRFLKQCDVLVVGAGAGMGRDSGLPDFRGKHGFWNHYPPYRSKFDFYACANPQFLIDHPHLFWGFYGSRLAMYREKQPHRGFDILKNIAKNINKQRDQNDNLFVVTSNVDGHFQKAGYAEQQIFECHGTIHHLQCTNCRHIHPNTFQPDVNYEEMSCRNLPVCEKCEEVERPNILMFNDWDWLEYRTSKQQSEYRQFVSAHKQSKVAIVEIGSGSAVPTIRNAMEQLYYTNKGSKFIRINPDSAESSAKWLDPHRYTDLACNALQALEKIEKEFSL